VRKYLIDSDILIDFLNNRAEAIRLLIKFEESEMAISAITFAEILEGLVGDRKKYLNVRKGLSKLSMLAVDANIAEKFASVRAILRKKGELIENMDIFIAATAMSHDLILVTNNKRDFERIKGLKLYEGFSN